MLAGHAVRHPALDLLLLHGSRARGEVRDGSDRDFGFLGGRDVDASALLGELVEALKTDRVDLADLARASGLLRFRAARDAVVLFERPPGFFDRSWWDAVSFWCEAGPVIARGYDAVLRDLER